MNIVVTLEEQIPLDATKLEPYIEEYIGGWIEKKVLQKKSLNVSTLLIFSVWISSI